MRIKEIALILLGDNGSDLGEVSDENDLHASEWFVFVGAKAA